MPAADGKRILFVDDDPDIRVLVATALDQEGYRVDTAMNGLDALSAIDRAAPDLILLDMIMPVMDGWQFVRRLRERHLDIPVVMVTAAENARERAREIGVSRWLGKPFDLDDLTAAVREGLGDARPAATSS